MNHAIHPCRTAPPTVSTFAMVESLGKMNGTKEMRRMAILSGSGASCSAMSVNATLTMCVDPVRALERCGPTQRRCKTNTAICDTKSMLLLLSPCLVTTIAIDHAEVNALNASRSACDRRRLASRSKRELPVGSSSPFPVASASSGGGDDARR